MRAILAVSQPSGSLHFSQGENVGLTTLNARVSQGTPAEACPVKGSNSARVVGAEWIFLGKGWDRGDPTGYLDSP